MDVRRLEQLKQDLLHGRIGQHRRLMVGLALFTVAFWTMTLAGGYLLVTHAMDDNLAIATRGIDTPTDVGLLFSGRDPKDMVNSLVFLNRVTIEPASAAADIYYAGDDSGTRVLVHVDRPGVPREQAVANVMGAIRPLTSQLLRKWKLSKKEQKAFKSQGVYLEAKAIKVQNASARLAESKHPIP